jgi:hypothetical protein
LHLDLPTLEDAVKRNSTYKGTAVAVANREPMANPLQDVREAAEALTRAQGHVDEARTELTRRIYAAADAGESRSTIARAAGVSRQWISNLLELRG